MRGSPCEKHQPPCTSHLLHAHKYPQHTHMYSPIQKPSACTHTKIWCTAEIGRAPVSPWLGKQHSKAQTHAHNHLHKNTHTYLHTPSMHQLSWIKDRKPAFTYMHRLSPATSANTPTQPHVHIRIPATKQLPSHSGDFNTSG